MKKRPSAAQLQKAVDKFNAKLPSGSNVVYVDDFGVEHKTTTRSEARLLEGHSAIVMLEGIAGGYSLDRVKAA